MEGSIQGPGDYSLIPVRGPQSRSGQGGQHDEGGTFDLKTQKRTQPKSKPGSDSPSSEELPVGQPDHDEAGRHIDVTG